MLIQIIVTLLLAGRVISSVSVQGSISIVNNDTMTIYLHTGKSSVGDDPDKLFRKLHEAKPNPRIHLVVYLGEKIVVIEGELENYLKSDKTTWRNIVEATDATKYRINTRRFALNENDYKTLCNNDAKVTTPRLRDVKKLVDGIDDVLRPIIVILEQRDDKMSYQNCRRIYSPIFEYSYPFTADLLLENERSETNRELEMFLDYAKSVQYHLSSLTKALDAKWRQSRDQLNKSLRRRLVALQKQAQFLLNSLPKRKRQRYEEKSGKKYRTSSKRSESNVTELKKSATSDTRREDEKNERNNIDEITEKESNRTASLFVHRDLTNGSRDGVKIERTTVLNKDDKDNVKALPLNETAVNANSFHKVHNKTQRKSKNETKDESVLQAETRFLNYPKSTRKFNYDYANTIATINTFYGLKNNTVKNNTVIGNVTEVTKSRNKNFVPKSAFVDQKPFTKTEQFIKSSHGDDANKPKTNLLNQMTNISAFLSTSEIIPSVLRKTDEKNQIKAAITTVKVAEKLMKPSLGINNNRNHALAKKIADNHHFFKTNVQNKTSTIIDEILDAVEQVLP